MPQPRIDSQLFSVFMAVISFDILYRVAVKSIELFTRKYANERKVGVVLL